MIFLWLLLAHLLYDFHWQGDFVAQNKSRYKFILVVHALTWALLLSLVLWMLNALVAWKLLFLFASHLVTDGWKSRLPRSPEWFWAIYVDQAIHVASIGIVAF